MSKALVKKNGNGKNGKDKPASDLVAAAAAAKKGIKTTTGKAYFLPVVPNEYVLWQVRKNSKGEIVSQNPYVIYTGLLDNVHRRGVKEIFTESLPEAKCKDVGCYNAGESDVQHRYHARITLANGQVFHGEGEACRHNTTRVTARSTRRMAETRAKARAMRDATNIGMACVVELDGFRGEYKLGDRILSAEDAEGQYAGDAAERARPVTPARPALPPAASDTSGKPSVEQEQAEALKVLHAAAAAAGLNIDGMHIHLHNILKVASLKDAHHSDLLTWARRVRELSGEKLERFREGFRKLAEEAKPQ